MKVVSLLVLAALAAPASALAQSAPRGATLAGTWQAQLDEGTYTIVIRADSSASYGDEVVRWRARGDSIYIALGGEWVGYRMSLRARQLTLSGGDLAEPITLRRIGPETRRPADAAVPPDPDAPR